MTKVNKGGSKLKAQKAIVIEDIANPNINEPLHSRKPSRVFTAALEAVKNMRHKARH